MSRVARLRLPLLAVATVLVVAGTFSPWATRAFGFPGKMTLSGFPGGARIYALVLLPVVVLGVADIRGRRRAGLLGALGVLAVGGFNVIAIANDGRGIDAVAFGAWITAAGGALLVLAFVSLPADRPVPSEWPKLPAAAELAIIAGFLGLLLYGVDNALSVNESSRFISFLLFAGFGIAVIGRLGLFGWLQELFARHRQVALVAGLITAAAFPFTQNGNAYWIRVFASIGVFATAAIGLNVVVGLAGLLDLGYIAFFGVGAYVGGLLGNASLSTMHVHVPFVLVIFIGASISALFGLVIGTPTLRLRGDYLAIVTLGFGEIFRITANNWDGLTRGPNGISGIPGLAVGSFKFAASHQVIGITLPYFANYYFIELLLLVVAITGFTRLNRSRIGRAWVAIREDEVAAAAMGVDTIRLKLLAFAIGAFLAGAAGTVNAHLATQVSPDSYTFLESILLLAAVVLGGMGTVPGALLGSAALFVIPEKLRSFQDYRLLLFGAALIVMMRFRPEGIVPSQRRRREFREEGSVGASGAPPGGPVATGGAAP